MKLALEGVGEEAVLAEPQAAARPNPLESFGPYRIVRKLGEGGMGEVWLAEQEAPLSRDVALKVIKAGMDSHRVVERFQTERQALALMDHPAIAKVFDAGETPRGRPYFAMEYVDGEPITAACDRLRLTVRGRLELFLEVCEGVQHAHNKGIVHRDIKPSNVLVRDQDGRLAPKIIDFGVAKAVERSPDDRSLLTEMGMMLGTPEYMSPEQMELSAVDVDTRTDVYSLGVTLYELVTGALPFDREELRRGRLDEVVRRICDEEPPTPSSRLTRSTEVSEESAANRGTDLSTLAKQLSGDLDWIVMEAVEKDRRRRYDTPSALAADIRRHLADEPVLARPPSRSDRARKFVRRHRRGVAASVLVALALVAGLAGTAWQARVAAAERDRVQLEADKLRASQDFLTGLFVAAGPRQAKGDPATALDLVHEGVARLDELQGQPAVRVEMMKTLCMVLIVLGEYEDAIRLGKESVELARDHHGDFSLPTADALHHYGDALSHAGKWADAEKALGESIAIRRLLSGGEPDEMLAIALDRRANPLEELGRFDEADELYREAIDMHRRVFGEDHFRIAMITNDYGNFLRRRGQYEGAAEQFREALRRWDRLGEHLHPDVAVALTNLGLTLDALGRADEAERRLNEALVIQRAVLPADHDYLAATLYNLGRLRRGQGDYEGSADAFRESGAMVRRTLGPAHGYNGVYTSQLAITLAEAGDYAQAAPLFDEAQKSILSTWGEDHERTAAFRCNMAYMLDHFQGRNREALQTFEPALETLAAHLGPDHPGVAGARSELGYVYLAAGRLDEAQAALDAALEVQRRSLPQGHARIGLTLTGLGWLALEQGHDELGRTRLEEARKIETAALPEGHWRRAETETLLGVALARRGRGPEARVLLQSALPILTDRRGSGYPPARMGRAVLESL